MKRHLLSCVILLRRLMKKSGALIFFGSRASQHSRSNIQRKFSWRIFGQQQPESEGASFKRQSSLMLAEPDNVLVLLQIWTGTNAISVLPVPEKRSAQPSPSGSPRPPF